jgi:hypothetical protein
VPNTFTCGDDFFVVHVEMKVANNNCSMDPTATIGSIIY